MDDYFIDFFKGDSILMMKFDHKVHYVVRMTTGSMDFKRVFRYLILIAEPSCNLFHIIFFTHGFKNPRRPSRISLAPVKPFCARRALITPFIAAFSWVQLFGHCTIFDKTPINLLLEYQRFRVHESIPLYLSSVVFLLMLQLRTYRTLRYYANSNSVTA